MKKCVVIGDSWASYPVPFSGGGIANHLGTFLGGDWVIQDLAHPGDASEQTLSLDHRHDIELAVKNTDAIVISSGGDSLAGPQLIELLRDNSGQGVSGAIDWPMTTAALMMVEGCFRDIISLANGIPVYTHTYDYAIPGNSPCCILGIPVSGPWIWPSLEYCGWLDTQDQQNIVRQFIDALATQLQGIEGLRVCDTRGTLQRTDWANEMHPTPNGFMRITKKVADAIIEGAK